MTAATPPDLRAVDLEVEVSDILNANLSAAGTSSDGEIVRAEVCGVDHAIKAMIAGPLATLEARIKQVEAERDEVPVYGIIDPDYARVFTIARCLAWAEGYALLMHGSFTRDLDLLAVPWAETVCEPEHLARRVEDAAGLKLVSAEPGQKPHGRLAWTMMFSGFSDPRFVDFSVLPKAALAQQEKADG